MGMKAKKFISRHRRFLIVPACIVLAVAVMVIIRNNTLESRLKREYGFYDVDVNQITGSTNIYLRLSDADLEKYFGTKDGEVYLDRVVPEIILEINDNKGVYDSFIEAAKENGSKDYHIYILIEERHEFGDSSKRKCIGAYLSDTYPAGEWFTEDNKKVQRWTKILGDIPDCEEKGAMSLSEIREMAKRNE